MIAGEDTSTAELRALADMPDTIIVGGKEFKIYPLTLGKLLMLGDVLIEIFPLIQMFGNLDVGKIDDEEADRMKSILIESIDQIAAAFVVITTPNMVMPDGGPPIVSKEDVEFAKYALELPQIPKIIATLKQSMAFEALLKNVPGPRETKANFPGEPLSPASSGSQNGASTISAGGPASEL